MRIFIPRDTGFLSFLNWFMGSVSSTKEPLYPFLNTHLQHLINKKSQNFCYNDVRVLNSWFLYFEPIVYSEFPKDEDSHESVSMEDVLECFKQRKVTQGWSGAIEFLFFHIADFVRHSEQSELFSKWREKSHEIYSRYIRPKPHILRAVNELSARVCAEAEVSDMTQFIGVHYRNPSHVKEQGKILFRDYFDKIDELLVKHPDSHIYLATDTDLAVAVFKERYGSLLHYSRSVYRTSVDDFVDWVFARENSPTDKEGFVGGKGYDSHAKVSETMDPHRCRKMGEDILVDMLMISKCAYFVHTISNFTITLSYVNPKIELLSVKDIDPAKYIQKEPASLNTQDSDEVFSSIRVRNQPEDLLEADRMYFNKVEGILNH